MIEGTGPRYCPSIEDKVVRFADKNRHQVFIEPEGLYTNEMYIGGMSSSLPEDVQEEMYHSVPGLEHAKIVKNAYAIEYDCINPRQLYPTLEFKKIKGLFSGGQFNGSSGYEEAAAQGLIAGINAALEVKGQEQLILDRSEAYIGVLIDDLVTKENHEPYRMMTSRAEYRLLLRQDNADLRLRKKGYQAGLISEEDYQKILTKEEQIKTEISRVEHTNIGANKEIQTLLESYNSTPLKSGTTLAELIRRPELSYEAIKPLDKERPELPWDVQEQAVSYTHLKSVFWIQMSFLAACVLRLRFWRNFLFFWNIFRQYEIDVTVFHSGNFTDRYLKWKFIFFTYIKMCIRDRSSTVTSKCSATMEII